MIYRSFSGFSQVNVNTEAFAVLLLQFWNMQKLLVQQASSRAFANEELRQCKAQQAPRDVCFQYFTSIELRTAAGCEVEIYGVKI